MIRKQWMRLGLTMLLCVACLSSTGCIGALAQLFYVIKGHEIPADYSEFEGKRVAIVVGTDSSAYGQDPLADKIERYVVHHFITNIDEIEIVPPLEIDNWIDINGWGDTPAQLADLGKGVEADLVLSINVEGYSIREGQTLYKGRSDVSLKVVNSLDGDVTYTQVPQHMEYPEHGRPAIQTDDRRFETFYLAWLTEQISRNFYAHDRVTDIADDAALLE